MLVKTTEHWLALPPSERFGFLRSHIEPILAGHPDVRLRFFDTEFFNSDVTDVLVCTTRYLQAYQAVVEALRETPFWDHYFRVVSILPGIENAYAAHYNAAPVGQPPDLIVVHRRADRNMASPASLDLDIAFRNCTVS